MNFRTKSNDKSITHRINDSTPESELLADLDDLAKAKQKNLIRKNEYEKKPDGCEFREHVSSIR